MTQDKESKVFKKISEIRKKISLCEGKRRAFYSVTEKEKSLNKEKTFLLQDELKVGMIDCNNKESFVFVGGKTILDCYAFHERQYSQKDTQPASPRQEALWKEWKNIWFLNISTINSDSVPALLSLCWITRCLTWESSWINWRARTTTILNILICFSLSLLRWNRSWTRRWDQFWEYLETIEVSRSRLAL